MEKKTNILTMLRACKIHSWASSFPEAGELPLEDNDPDPFNLDNSSVAIFEFDSSESRPSTDKSSLTLASYL